MLIPPNSPEPDPNNVGKAVVKIIKEVPATKINVPKKDDDIFYKSIGGIKALDDFFRTSLAKYYSVFTSYIQLGRMCTDRNTALGVILATKSLLRQIGLPEGGDKQRHKDALAAIEDAYVAIYKYNATLEKPPGYRTGLAAMSGLAVGLLESENGPTK